MLRRAGLRGMPARRALPGASARLPDVGRRRARERGAESIETRGLGTQEFLEQRARAIEALQIPEAGRAAEQVRFERDRLVVRAPRQDVRQQEQRADARILAAGCRAHPPAGRVRALRVRRGVSAVALLGPGAALESVGVGRELDRKRPRRRVCEERSEK